MKTIRVSIEMLLPTTVTVTLELPDQPQTARVELDSCSVTNVERNPDQPSLSPFDFFEQAEDADVDRLEKAINAALPPAKREKCVACNGSGHYDHDGAPPCDTCNGRGYELLREWK